VSSIIPILPLWVHSCGDMCELICCDTAEVSGEDPLYLLSQPYGGLDGQIDARDASEDHTVAL